MVDKGGWVFFGSLNGDGGVDGWSKVVVGYSRPIKGGGSGR